MIRPRHLLLPAAFLAPLAAALCAWSFAPPLLNSDSATGFSVWESMARGGGWNRLTVPDPANISHDTTRFLSWWSPGQYLFPGAVHALGFTWCHAALLIILAAGLLACLGVWRLSLRLGLTRDQAALAALLVSLGGDALHGFGMFAGGDILLAAVTPFLYLAALRIRDLPPAAAFPAVFSLSLLGLLLKHSAIITLAAALLFLALESARRHGRRLLRDTTLWIAGSAVILALLCSHLLWIRGGPTPGAPAQVNHPALASLGFSLNGPWFALTGGGSLLSWFLQHTGFDRLGETDGWRKIGGALLASGAAGTAIVAWLGLRRGASRVWSLAACAWLATSGLLAALYLRGASVSLDSRHFIPAVAPLAAALAACALPRERRNLGHHAALLLALLTLSLGPVAHLRRVRLLSSLPHGPRSGFSQPDLSPPVARALLAAAPPSATLVLLNPPEAFDLTGRRLLPTDALFRSREELARWRFAGAVPALAIAMPAAYEQDGRGALLRAAFTDMPAEAWRSLEIDGHLIWSCISPAPTTRP